MATGAVLSTAGPNDASTGLGVRYLGSNHCYAFSGQVGTDSTQTLATMLNFTTGNHYIIGSWTVCGAVNKDGDSGTGGIDQFYFSLNGLLIHIIKTETGEEDQPGSYTIPVLIPPFSTVLCQGVSSLDNINWVISQSIIGAVHEV